MMTRTPRKTLSRYLPWDTSRPGRSRRNETNSVLVILCLLLPAPAGLTAENDSFTTRHEWRWDAASRINRVINQRIAKGISAINQSSENCDDEALYTGLKSSIGDGFFLVGHNIAMDLDRQPRLSKSAVPLDQSIYQDMHFLSGISLHVADLISTVEIDGHVIGLDKFGHFFAQGWTYFETFILDERDIEEAMAWGQRKERWGYGLTTTGVYSYADLVANFNGMRFWIKLIEGTAPDPIGQLDGRSSYLSCKRGQWVLQRPFDIRFYIDGAWDEGNNCNRYSSEAIDAQVKNRIRSLEKKRVYRYQCPIDPPACVSAREKYGEYSASLLHPDCLNAEESSGERLIRRMRSVVGFVWGLVLTLWDAVAAVWGWFFGQ